MSSLVWVELDREAPAHNLRQLRAGSAPGTLACAVVKGNAYGHGVAQIAPLLSSADWFGVNSLEEGLELRGLGITRPIVLLGHVPLAGLEAAIQADLSLTIYNRETVERLSALPTLPRPARVHVKVDTGTGRQGVLPEDVEDFVRLVKGARNVKLEGLSTH
jgi:alanine racemase